MKQTGIAGSALGAIVLALWMLRVSVQGPAQPNNSKPAETTSGNTEKKQQNTLAFHLPQDGPWLASRNHFAGMSSVAECQEFIATGQDKQKPEDSQSAHESPDQRRKDVWCIPHDEQVRAMIAVVPDPVHTHMSLFFDRSLEAVNLAAESAGYVMDRYWLPWRPLVSTTSSDASSQHDTDNESLPGLMIFRWNGPASQTGEPDGNGATLLYVFVVSDTATDGMNGSQFYHAVEYIRDVCAPDNRGCGKMDAIRVMGPTFSGSLYSLRRLVKNSASKKFVAYSGTVSSLCAIQNQELLKHHNDNCGEWPGDYAEVPNLQFASLVTNSETAVRNFLHLLQQDHQISCDGQPEVAILSEAATSYGSASRAANKNATAAKQHNDDTKQQQTGDQEKPDVKQKSCYADLSYPREISNLRNAYQSAGKHAPTLERPGAAVPQNYLPFDLADLQPNTSDEPPDFSRTQGPLSKEAVLMDYAADLRREHYKYVGIIGSNILDIMFLASFLRTSCPDIRLFVLNADLLFERDLDNAPYIGTLSLTTYPRFARNLDWTSNGQLLPRLPFADQYEQGQFNAALLLIKGIVPQQSDGMPYEITEPFHKPTEASADSSLGSTDPPSALPLWLTVIGTGGFWPVQVETTSNGGNPPAMETFDYSPAWKTVVIVLSALAFLQILVIFAASPLSSRLQDFAVAGPACTQRAFFINVASANLALCLALAAAPAWIYGSDPGSGVGLISTIAAVTIVAVFATCFHVHEICYRRQKARGTSRLHLIGLRALYMAIWILAALGALLWCRLLLDDSGHYGFFFAYRAIHLATGVSPLTPMLPLCACMYVWSIFELLRLRFNDSARPRLQAAQDFPGAASEMRIAKSVNRYLLDGKYTAAFVVLFGVWLLAFNPLHPFQLFERFEFALLYEIWFCLVVMLMLSSGLRLGQVWAEMRKLLRELERSRIRETFGRLKGESWSPIWQSGGQEDEWTNMARTFEVIRQIRISGNSMDPDLCKSIERAEKAREEIRALVRSCNTKNASFAGKQTGKAHLLLPAGQVPLLNGDPFRGLQDKFCEIQDLLSRVLGYGLRMLQDHWNTHCAAADETHNPADKQIILYCAPQPTPAIKHASVQMVSLVEHYVALRYVAFIRGVLGHVRLLLIFLAISFSLMLLSLNVYSFEPHQSLIWSFTAIFAVIGLTAVGVLMEAHRNEILSVISGTKPNELGLAFYVRIASLGAAPLVALLATHFPSISRFLLSFFQPGLEALK